MCISLFTVPLVQQIMYFKPAIPEIFYTLLRIQMYYYSPNCPLTYSMSQLGHLPYH